MNIPRIRFAGLLAGLAALALLLLLPRARVERPEQAARANRPGEPAELSPSAAAPVAVPGKLGPNPSEVAPSPKRFDAHKAPQGPNPLDRLAKSITAAPGGTAAAYVIRDRSSSTFFTNSGIVFTGVGRPTPGAGASEVRGYALQWGLVGAAEVRPRPEGERIEKVNTYIGDPSKWTSEQKSFSSLVYDGVQPGVDMRIQSQEGGIKYTLEVAPGADVSQLRFRYQGVKTIDVDPNGTSVDVRTEIGVMHEAGLVCYQETPQGRRAVEAHYEASGDAEYRIAVGEYDPELPLTVDPVMGWASLIGGSVAPQGEDEGFSIAVDSGGNVFVTGYTYCVDFPVLNPIPGGGALKGSIDGFLIKLNPNGTPAWATYLGGAGGDYCYGVAVDAGGSAYVTGLSASFDFPITANAYQKVPNGYDAFVTKFNPGGTINWSTFLGGNNTDYGLAIAVDGTGVYVSGYTYSTNFPIQGGFKATPSTTPDGFVAKVKPDGTGLIYSSYLGGNNTDYIYGMAVDSTGAVYVTGYTYSTDFPGSAVLGGATLKGTVDAFLTKITFNGTNASIAWSTYLGGTNSDYGYGVTVTNDVVPGDPVVVGYSYSTDFPFFNPIRTVNQGGEAFVTRIKSDGSAFVYSTFVGGNNTDVGQAIAPGPAGSVYITGYTYSSDFPHTAGAFQSAQSGSYDGFVTRLSATGTLDFSTYLGGNNTDYARSVATVLPAGAAQGVYVAGTTYSSNWPAIGGLDSTLGGQLDAFATKLPLGLGVPNWSTYIGGNHNLGIESGYGVAVDPTTANTVFITGNTTSSDFPITAGALDVTIGGNQDVYLMKFQYTPGTPDVGTLLWSTYIGGSSYDYASGLAVDTAGYPYVVGYTASFDYPHTVGPAAHGGYDAFVTELTPAGAMFYSALLGGSNTEYGTAIAVDGSYNAYVTGYTYSSDLATPGGFQLAVSTTPDGFVSKLDVSGNLIWETYLGGTNTDVPLGIAVNSAGSTVFVTGYTYSTDFPTKPPGSTILKGGEEAFVTAISSSVGPPSTASLLWSRFLGGSTTDQGNAIAVDPSGTYLYAVGYTYSADFPTLAGIKMTMTGGEDSYVTRLDPSTGNIVWSTFLGGSSSEYAFGAAVDTSGDVFVTGYTYSADFPNKGAFQPSIAVSPDAFITKIYPNGASIAWSSFIGGSSYDYGEAVAVDSAGVVYVTGYTFSSDFPFLNGISSTLGGGQDAFLVRLDNAPPAPPDFASPGTGQFKMDGTTQLAVGAWTTEDNFVVKAKVTDSDDDQVYIEVEVKTLDVDFDGTNTHTSPLFNSGQIVSVQVPLQLVAPRRYHWRARSIDYPMGHTSAWVSFGGNADLPLPAARDVGKDQVAPILTLLTPTTTSPYYTGASSIAITCTASDDASGVNTVTWVNSQGGSGAASLSAGTWTIPSVSLVASTPATAIPNNITISATDAAGNVGTLILTVYRDNTPPGVTVSGSDFATANGSPTISGTASDNVNLATVTWVNNKGGSGTAAYNPATGNWSAIIAGLSPGVNVITITATDGAGNTTTTVRNITYDTTPPLLSISTPANNVVTKLATVDLTGTASDNVALAAVPISWSNTTIPATTGTTTVTAGSWTITGIPIQAGANNIQVTATDSVGLQTTTAITVYRDNILPTIVVSSPVTPFTTGANTIALSGTCADNLGVASVHWSRTPVGLPPDSGNANMASPGSTSSTWSIASVSLNPGPNSISVTSVDKAGNISTPFVVTVNYNTNAPSVTISTPATNPYFTNIGGGVLGISGLASVAGGGSLTGITCTNLTTGLAFPVGSIPAIPPNQVSVSWTSSVVLQDGANTIQIVASDNSLPSPLQTFVSFVVVWDTTPPNVKITGPTTADTYATSSSTLLMSGTASDTVGLATVAWSTDALGVVPASGNCMGTTSWTIDPLNPIPLALGSQNVTITATDKAGNQTTATLAVLYDPTNPTIAITFPSVSGSFVTKSSTIALQGTAGDDNSVQTVTWLNAATGNSGPASGTGSWSVAAIALNPGLNPITAIATDIAGNIKTATINVSYDTAAPTITVASPVASGTYITAASNVSVSGTASDDIGIASVQWANAATGINGTAIGTTSWSDPAIGLLAGDNLITVKVTDLVGNFTSASITVHCDPTLPSIAITSPTSSGSWSTTVNQIALSGTSSDLPGGSPIPVDVSQVSWFNLTTGGSGTATLTPGGWNTVVPLTQGTNSIQVTAYDAAGNFSSASITVVYDAAAPFVSITTPTSNLTYSTGTSPVLLSGTASDDIGVVSVTWQSDAAVIPNSGTAAGTTGWSASVPLAPGVNTFTVTAQDGVGRIGTARLTITYDPTPPTVAITIPTADPLFLTTITPIALGGAATDNLLLQSVTWANTTTGEQGVASGVGAWTVSAVNLVVGNNVIVVTATDSVGNQSTATVTINYDGTPPTVAIDPPVTVPPGPPYATTTRPFLITGTAGDNLQLATTGAVTWTNSLGGGGTANTVGTATAVTWSASVYLLTGTNVITVTATDAHGYTTSAQVSIDFTPESVAPTVAITGPTATGTAISANQVVTLSGNADDNVAVVSVTWYNQATGVKGTAVLTPVPASTAVTWTADVPLASGTNVIIVTAADDAGNLTPTTITVTYTSPSDAIVPAVSIIVPTTTGVYSASSSPVTVVALASDNIGVASVTWSNAATGGGGVATPLPGGNWSAGIGLGAGANTVTFTAVDSSGNTATAGLTVNFVPPPGDTSNPVVTITSYPTNVSLDVSVSALDLAGTASDNVQVAEVVWFNAADNASGDATGTDAWTASLILHPGVNVITMRAFDTSGNTSTDQLTVVYTPPPPPPPPPVHIAAGACGLLGLEVCLPLFVAMAVRRRRREGKGSKA
jgi:hypothetical protein